MKYGTRTIISDRFLKDGKQGYYVTTVCDCGKVKDVREWKLKNGEGLTCTSCSAKTHGDSNTRLYRIWRGIKTRTKYHDKYESLGMSDEWNYDYEKFKEWAIKNGYKEDLSIDRIDNKKGYYEDNCRWTNEHIQACNRGFMKNKRTKGVSMKNGKFIARITIKGKTKHLGAFSSEEDAVEAYDNFIINNNLSHTTNKEIKEDN